MVRDVGAHVLPRGEGGRVVVVSYIHVFHSYYKGKYRVVIVRRKKKLREVGLWSWSMVNNTAAVQARMTQNIDTKAGAADMLASKVTTGARKSTATWHIDRASE